METSHRNVLTVCLNMRVLHVASTFARGGIATSLWHLLPALQSRGIDLEIAGLYELGFFGERLARHGILARSLGFATKYDVLALRRLVLWLERERFDLIHAHGWPAIFFTAVAARLVPSTTFFYTEHSTRNRRRRYKLKTFERWMYRAYSRIIAVSGAAASALEAWLPETGARTRVIYNAISPAYGDAVAVTPSTGHFLETAVAPLILSASGTEFRKGTDVLLEAFYGWKGPPAFTLAIAGWGGQKGELRARAKGLRLDAQTRWLGYIPDLAAVMRQADVFVVPSRYEGFSMVTLEAMTMGKPIVATAVGGVPELIENEISGLLVPPENPGALGDAISRVLQDRILARCLGEAARSRSRRFQADEQARRVAELYAEKKSA